MIFFNSEDTCCILREEVIYLLLLLFGKKYTMLYAYLVCKKYSTDFYHNDENILVQ